LIIRAMALGEVKLRDWWRCFFAIDVGTHLGHDSRLHRVDADFLWPTKETLYGPPHYGDNRLMGMSLSASSVGEL